MSKKPIIVPCYPMNKHHLWVFVWGVHAGPGHLYTERRCIRCQMYESEVR